MSNVQGETGSTVKERVSAVIERLRPYIQGDGGDIRFIDVDDQGVVQVQLRGACVGCPSAMMTLKMGVERAVKEQVPEVTEVIPV
jgi:Fe-S cluster biogenesis protein NfuA